MKNKKTSIVIAILLIVLLIVIAVLYINYVKNKSTNASCNYNDPNKTYIKKDSNCVINFLCIQGKTAFSDECGCGCESV